MHFLKVIKKYKSLHEDLEYQNDELEDISFNLLSMMIFFLEDYYEYGVYSNIKNILEVNGNGEIDWNRTIMDKRRPKANVSEVMNIIGDVKGKTCILYDDLVDTAGSLCNAAKALVEIGGAKEVFACATHGVLSGPAYDRIEESPIKCLKKQSFPIAQ